MVETGSLRAEHDVAEVLIDQLFDLLGQYRTEADAEEMVHHLAQLARVLRSHFAREDHLLYPTMIESDHREAAVTARVFRSELGPISGQFERFIERWADSDAIAASLRQFEFEAGLLFADLRDRIHRENRDLYPLAEQVRASRDAHPTGAATAARESLSA